MVGVVSMTERKQAQMLKDAWAQIERLRKQRKRFAQAIVDMMVMCEKDLATAEGTDDCGECLYCEADRIALEGNRGADEIENETSK